MIFGKHVAFIPCFLAWIAVDRVVKDTTTGTKDRMLDPDKTATECEMRLFRAARVQTWWEIFGRDVIYVCNSNVLRRNLPRHPSNHADVCRSDQTDASSFAADQSMFVGRWNHGASFTSPKRQFLFLSVHLVSIIFNRFWLNSIGFDSISTPQKNDERGTFFSVGFGDIRQ